MWWQLTLIGVGLAVNNALGSVALGAARMKRSTQWRIAFIFAVFEAAMPVGGMLLGQNVAALIGNHARYIGVVILLAIGIYMIVKKRGGSEDASRAPSGFYTIVLAVMLSLDNLTVGFGLGMLQFSLGLAALTFGVISLCMTVAGLEVGRYMGNKFTLSADRLSGVVLVATGALMFFR